MWLESLISLIPTLVRWGVGFAVIMKFSKPISDLIDRIKSFQYKDTLIVCGKNGSPEQNIPSVDKDEFRNLPPINDDDIAKEEIEAWEKSISECVDKQSKEQRYSEKDLLIRELALRCCYYNLECIYNVMFRSQYEALDYLVASKGGIAKTDLYSFYKEASNAYPSFYNSFSYDNWLQFLASCEFLEEKENKYLPTKKSRLFIQYIACREYNKTLKLL